MKVFIYKDFKLSIMLKAIKLRIYPNRDYNAALNILDEGLRNIIGLSSPEFTPADCPTMDDRGTLCHLKSSDRMKQEKNEKH